MAQLRPTCPACGHEMTDDEMMAHDSDLFAMAPNEEEEDIECPACEEQYLCRGTYIPQYESTLDPDGF